MFSYLNRAIFCVILEGFTYQNKNFSRLQDYDHFLFLQRSDGGGVFDIQDRINGLALCGCSTLAACQVLCCFLYNLLFIFYISGVFVSTIWLML